MSFSEEEEVFRQGFSLLFQQVPFQFNNRVEVYAHHARYTMSTIGRAPYPRSVTGSACEPPSFPTPIAASATTSDASAIADDPPRVLRRTSSGFGTDPSPDGPPSVVTHAASVADNANRVPLPGDLTPDALDQLRIRPVAAWGSRRTSTTSTRAAPLASPAATHARAKSGWDRPSW